MKPLVSVLMPVYNGERFLQQSVQSILNQTFVNFELIITDDGSTDHSMEIARSFGDPRIRVNAGTHMGLSATHNRGLAHANGDYVAIMDADDISASGRLEAQVAFLNENPHVGLVGTGHRVIDESGVMGSRVRVPESDGEIRSILIKRNPITHPTVMMRAALLRQAKGYNEEFRCSQDYDLWLRMSRLCALANIDQPLLYYRFHPGSLTTASQKRMLWEGTVIKWRTLGRRGYPWSKALYLIPGLFLLASPMWLVARFRRWQWMRTERRMD